MTSSETPLPLVKTWLEYLHRQGRSPHTLKAYQRAWQHLTEWYEGSYGEPCDPARLIARDIRDWKSYQQSVEKAAPSTINQRLVVASSFYKWATSQDQTPRDPTRDVSTIRLPQRQPQSLSAKELRRLLRAVHNGGSLRAVAMIELLVGTGVRVGELLQLQVGDLVLHERSGWVTVREGKHGGYRQIPLAKEVCQALTDYLTIHPINNEEHEQYQDERTPLWCGKHGPLTHRSYAAILTQACNMTLSGMADLSDLSYDQLLWCTNWYIREETLQAATDILVNFQYQQPLSQHWGSGTFSSSDGQRFAVARKTNKASPLPRYFGFGRGLTMVTWTSDQLSQYGIRVTPPRIRESTYTLDAILDNETSLNIKEHTTDTAGYTDMMFALFDLLGMQFSPRLRDIGDYTLFHIDTSIKYKHINPLLSPKPLKTALFVDDWDELLRVAASMKMGWVTASTFIRAGLSPPA